MSAYEKFNGFKPVSVFVTLNVSLIEILYRFYTYKMTNFATFCDFFYL